MKRKLTDSILFGELEHGGVAHVDFKPGAVEGVEAELVFTFTKLEKLGELN